MGLMDNNIDTLIHLTSLIHRGAQLTSPFQWTDVVRVAQSADQIIQSTSSEPASTNWFMSSLVDIVLVLSSFIFLVVLALFKLF